MTTATGTTATAATDWAALYRAHVDAVAALAERLTAAELATVLPGTPAWTVHDVLAHLAGGPADMASGRVEGAPGPEWTARHVAERQGIAVSDLMAELRSHGEFVAGFVVDNPMPAVVWDIATHLADLHEGLGLGPVPEPLWAPIVPALAERQLRKLPVEIACGTRSYGSGGPATDVTPYELFRALFSRRSRAQMRAWGGSVLTDEQLDTIPVFGPREDDQPTPSDGCRA